MNKDEPGYIVALAAEKELISQHPEWAPAYELLGQILGFLKESGAQTGFTSGTACASLYNHHIGLSHLNPLEFGLIPERYFGAGPFFPVLLDGLSYSNALDFLKTKDITRENLLKLDISIRHDPRLDYLIASDLPVSLAGLNGLVKRHPKLKGTDIDSFLKWCDNFTAESSPEILDFWTEKAFKSGFLELAEQLPQLRPDNYYQLMIYQEEWMLLVKDFLQISMTEANQLRRQVGKRISDATGDFESRMTKALVTGHGFSVDKAVRVSVMLAEVTAYLGCKAGWVGEGYIQLLTA